MLKISFIGAASLVFGQNLISDLLAIPTLRNDTLICLEDIDAHRLDLIYRYFQKYKDLHPKELENVTFEKTTDQKKAVEDAKYIINAVHIGGLDAYKLDVEIPFKYGVSQTVGDTLGPGGVFRLLRTTNFFKTLLIQMKDVGYNAGKGGLNPLLLNYTNPMAMNTWYCNSIYPDSTIGLCHGVQGTAELLTRWIGAKPEEVSYFCAGINHMAWFLEFWYKDLSDPYSIWRDAYPMLHEAFEKNAEKLAKHKGVRWDMMEATGYFMTESDGHLSEYLPYYRKRKDLLQKYKVETHWLNSLEQAADYEQQVKLQDKLDIQFQRRLKKQRIPFRYHPSDEYASHIINAIETGMPFRFNGNVINKEGGLITNLPRGCCVEVPVFADDHGLHPQGGIELPTICQALCTSNIMVQKAAVEGALTLDREKIYHSVLLDPNTASVCSPAEVRDMVDEMINAESKWIPKL